MSETAAATSPPDPDPSSTPTPGAELPTAYTPADTEPAVRARWDATDLFHAEPGLAPGQQAYSILIPPPNVTAPLHLGHALNNTLQDMLIRYHRMRGDNTLWMPGTDHAGIATQTVVEKRLLAEGVKRLEMGREKFVETTQSWKDEYEAVILDQLSTMGASIDAPRTRFTMDDMCATAVRHAFFELFRDGLIYRGKRLVNWDPVTRTALADDEVEMEEIAGSMWYLRYPLTGDPLPDGTTYLTVATTRPETMLGDTAVAINPADPRAEALAGRTVTLPIVGREIPVIIDDYVVLPDPDGDAKAQYSSGALKVTPAHDTNDWELGLRHDLPVINVMGPDGSISDQHGWDDVSAEARAFVGLSREDARTAIVAWFDDHDLLEDVREYSHSVGHSYRSHVPIEPWLSDQWYVAVTDDRLRGAALRAQSPDQIAELPDDVRPRRAPLPKAGAPDDTASGESDPAEMSPGTSVPGEDPTGGITPGDSVPGEDPAGGITPGDGALRFHPPRYARTYAAWHHSIRDWCISRQLWWGHQIPVWTRTTPTADASPEAQAALVAAEIDEPRPIDSRFTAAGAAHIARRVTADEIDESVCVPPDSTLRRRTRIDDSLDEPALVAALEAAGFERDPDVLDTWFSSGLWPLSTMGWPWPEDFPETVGLLDTFNPTSVLCTAREIITLWVSRMVMFNRYFLDGAVPFDDVFIHAMIQDGHGQKMSKSLGNGVDPRDIIHSHGADAMRFTLVQMTTDTQDVRMPVDMVCPHTGEAFEPTFITTPAGHVVAAPVQNCPSDPAKTMVSAYGAAAGAAEPTDESPLARNTSPKFDVGRNFANKLWNATRFALRRLTDAPPATEPVALDELRFVDRWILARLHQTVITLESAIDRYQFNQYADALYDFVWRDVCDRYLEAVKPTVNDDPNQQVVLGAVLDAVLRIMAPVCPFVTETLWPHVSAARPGDVAGIELPPAELLAGAAWPTIDLPAAARLVRVGPPTAAADDDKSLAKDDVIDVFDRADTLVGLIRSLRAERQVKPRQQVTLHVPTGVAELVASTGGVIEALAGVGAVVDLDDGRPAAASPLAFEGAELYVSGLVDEVDLDAERTRLTKTIDDKAKQIRGFEAKLANEGYVNNAKPELVRETRDLLAAARADLAAAESALASLG